MPNISLPTGKVIYLSVYEWLFQLEEKNVDEFYQSCIADDLGSFIEDPFSQRMHPGRLEVEEAPEIEEVAVVESYE
jgi:hypothetical protein